MTTRLKAYENTRVNGQAIYTPLSQLPARFTFGPHTRVMSEYLARRWSAHSFGWFKRTGKTIEYNREHTPHVDDTPRYRADDRRFRWVEHPSDGLRFVGKAHEIRGSGEGNLPWFDRALVDHNGWYMDNYQEETAWGEVYQLPSRNGLKQYVPAICNTNDDRGGNDGATLDFHSVTDDLVDAIKWSDSMAERYAEDEREYQAKEDVKRRIEDNIEEIKTVYAGFKALAKEIRGNCDKLAGMDAVKQLIRAEYRRVKGRVRKLRAEIRDWEENGIIYN